MWEMMVISSLRPSYFSPRTSQLHTKPLQRGGRAQQDIITTVIEGDGKAEAAKVYLLSSPLLLQMLCHDESDVLLGVKMLLSEDRKDGLDYEYVANDRENETMNLKDLSHPPLSNLLEVY